MSKPDTPFGKANSIYLPAFARGEGVEMKSQGRSFGSSFCPCCGEGEHKAGNKVSVFVSNEGIWRWKCFACNTPPSSAVDYASALWGVTAKEAVERINRNLDIAPTTTAPTHFKATAVNAEDDNKSMEAALKLLFKSAGKNVATEYLGGRGIPAGIVQEAFERKLVMSTSANPHANLAFLMEVVGPTKLIDSGLLKAGKKWPAIAFRPVIFPLGKDGAEFRAIKQYGSDDVKSIRYGRLHHPWWWKSATDTKSVMLVEGAIDALSVVSMGWQGHVLSLPGVSSWRQEWFEGIQKKYPSAHFFLGFDNDKPGNDAAEAIGPVLERLGIIHSVYSPPSGNDWNDLLMAGGFSFTEKRAA